MEENVGIGAVDEFSSSQKADEESCDFSDAESTRGHTGESYSKSSSDVRNREPTLSRNQVYGTPANSSWTDNTVQKPISPPINANFTEQVQKEMPPASRIKVSNYLEEWLQGKKKRNREYLTKYLRRNPTVSQYKREHIEKFGKPNFMSNAKAFLLRQEFMTHRNRFYDSYGRKNVNLRWL